MVDETITLENLTPQQEMFCRYYSQNDELFSNGTLAYAEAYDYRLDEMSHDRPVLEKDEHGKPTKSGDSEYDKAYSVCAVGASRLLRKANIQSQVTAFLNDNLKDDIVDSQMAKLIMQDRKYESKIAAIREYNKLRQRITEKTDITTGGDKIQSTVLPELIAEADRLLKEKKLNG